MSNSSTPAASQAPGRVRSPWIAVGGVLLVLALVLVMPDPWRSVVVLGIVEGVTEFLPISSTGHLLIASRLLGFNTPLGSTFEIFIQLGAVLAVVGYFARDLLGQLRAAPRDRQVQRFWLGILLAFLPAAVIGVLFRGFIKTVLLDSPSLIAWALIVGGIVFIVVERLPQRPATTDDVQSTSWRQALAIGCAQVLAFVPGVSRSGASIIGGMLAGLDRRSATAFAFYLSIPTLGAATLVDLLGSLDKLTPTVAGQLLLGTVVSGVVAWLSIGWLLRYVATNNFVPFGIYRIAAGVVILALVAAGRL